MMEELDPSLQRILDTSGQLTQGKPEREFRFQSAHNQPMSSFEFASRKSYRDPMLLSENNNIPRFESTIPSQSMLPQVSQNPYELSRSHNTFQTGRAINITRNHDYYTDDSPVYIPHGMDISSTRLSLPPQRTISQQDEGSQVTSSANHHLRFTQHLRQGRPLSQAKQHSIVSQVASPISQLATNMIFQRQMPIVAPNPISFPRSQDNHHLFELQKTKQQVNQPFNLSGFVYSPVGSSEPQKSMSSSSPPLISSPSTRLHRRRLATQKTASKVQAPFLNGPQEPNDQDDHLSPPRTPYRQKTSAVNHMPGSASDYAAPSFTRFPNAQSTLVTQHAPPIVQGIQLVSPHELPDRFRPIFPYQLFNAAQSKSFHSIYKTTDNVIVSAPTGSGKTVLLELAICKLFECNNMGNYKIVYQAPIKSLCAERVKDWSKKFSHLNLLCAELTGDTSQKEMSRVREASIIVTTPEKWDSITRKWADYEKLLQMVKLFLIDEVHILKDLRGATLEAVVSRMKSLNTNIRFIALSATVPNSHDIALWLGKEQTNQHLPPLREVFDEDFRPVKLQKYVHGFDGAANDFAFETSLTSQLPGLIQQYSHKKPIMVFCYSRKSCESSAAILAEWWAKQHAIDRAWPAPTQKTVVGGRELQLLVNSGVAFHHAGLDAQDRSTIENAYLKGDISVICCTSTLAVGVNLPCHLVILKGTICFSSKTIGEYSDLEVMQMLGRAGRPQFDDSAVAVIMTRKGNVERYKKMIAGQDILESTLHLNLIEHLNSEIALGTIKNLEGARRWLNGTFLSVRMRQNPSYYKFDGVSQSGDADVRLQLVCERDISLLRDHRLMSDHGLFSSTVYGQAMSRYMVSFETMKLLLSLPAKAKISEIASEFKDLRMKPNERVVLRELNKSPLLKYPIKENVTTTAHKVCLMVQVQLGGIDPPDSKEWTAIRLHYTMEKNMIFDRLQRLIRCIVDCKAEECDSIATRNGLDFARSLSAQYWENSNLQLRQIASVGPAAHRKLVAGHINSIDKLRSVDSTILERIMVRNPPYGKNMLDSLKSFPCLTIAAEILGQPSCRAGENPKVKIKARLGYSNAKVPTWNNSRPSLTFMAETSDKTLVHFWRGGISKLERGLELIFLVEVSCENDTILCYCACDEIVGTGRSIKLTSDVPASAFPPRKPILEQIQDSGTDNIDSDNLEHIEDGDLLAALNNVENNAALSDYGSDDFADIDELDDAIQTVPPKVEQVETSAVISSKNTRMNNGRWICNHICGGGQLLKNGQPCKHKCCRDGLEKPAKTRKRQRSISSTSESLAPLQPKMEASDIEIKKFAKVAGSKVKVMSTSPRRTARAAAHAGLGTQTRRPAQTMVKNLKEHDLNDIEVVDLAQQLSPVSYKHLKLDIPHLDTNGIRGSPLLEPKALSQISGQHSMHKLLDATQNFDASSFGSECSFDNDIDLPHPSTLFSNHDSHVDPLQNFVTGPGHIADIISTQNEPAEILEATMIELGNSLVEKQTGSNTNIETPFVNDMFDFEGYDLAKKGEQYSSPPRRQSCKRVRSRSPTPTAEMSAMNYEADNNNHVSQDERTEHEDTTTKTEAPQPSFPAWLNDIDQDIVDDLKEFVDFVD